MNLIFTDHTPTPAFNLALLIKKQSARLRLKNCHMHRAKGWIHHVPGIHSADCVHAHTSQFSCISRGSATSAMRLHFCF